MTVETGSRSSANTEEAPLEDLMAAMDVVDTLRHQQGIAERELDGEGRRERLLDRLRDLYQAQGIDVTDHVLQEGIDALEQERFQYQAVAPSWQTKLAHIWVSRGRWGKPVGFLSLVATVFLSYYVVADVLPERRLQANLPQELQTVLGEIRESAKNPDIIEQAEQSVLSAKRSVDREDYASAKTALADMTSVAELLNTAYTLRVVSKPNQSSGVWRVPPNKPQGRNYYLIVEAIGAGGKAVEIDVLNEENNQRVPSKQWGLRVNEETFYRIAADKKDDGIIQRNVVGAKRLGYLKPDFTIPTTGATITKW